MKPETREIKLSLETATRWYNGTDKELKELALQTFPELAKKELPKSWGELGEINGYYVSTHSIIYDGQGTNTEENRNTFATENQAKSALAMAKLSQVMAEYNDGWVADWNDATQVKRCIVYNHSNLAVTNSKLFKEFLTFKNTELAEEFLENFREDIETYFNF